MSPTLSTTPTARFLNASPVFTTCSHTAPHLVGLIKASPNFANISAVSPITVAN